MNGYGHVERDIDRRLAQKPKLEIRNRSNMAAIPMYLEPVIQTQQTLIHCMFCGHPIVEIKNKIVYVSTYPAHYQGKIAADTIACKRCKQRYIKIV